MAINSLHEYFVNELKDAYSAERQILKELPAMADMAVSPDLKQAFTAHLAETKEHVSRLDKVFALLEMEPVQHTCKAMKGILEEGGEVLGSDLAEDMADVALAGAALRVERYEITVYGNLCELARVMNHAEARTLLEETYQEEQDAASLVEASFRSLIEEVPTGHQS